MRAIVKTKKGPGIESLEVEKPHVTGDGILIKVSAASLCGSDIHIYDWSPGYESMPLPVTIGHEFSGVVVEVGSSVETVSVGDRVTASPFMPCGRCGLCVMGRKDSCRNKSFLGLTADGAFADYLWLRSGTPLFHLDKSISDEAASLCEPLGVALYAVEQSKINPGEKAAVLGPGPIGLLTVQVLRSAGASLILAAGAGGDRKRLEIAEQLGSDVAINGEEKDPVRMAMELTGDGFDVVFEATGNPTSIPQAIRMVRPRGKVVLIGIHSGPAAFDPTELVRMRKSIIGSHTYETETLKRALSLLSSGRIETEKIITHRLPLTEIERGFDLAIRREAAKVLFLP